MASSRNNSKYSWRLDVKGRLNALLAFAKKHYRPGGQVTRTIGCSLIFYGLDHFGRGIMTTVHTAEAADLDAAGKAVFNDPKIIGPMTTLIDDLPNRLVRSSIEIPEYKPLTPDDFYPHCMEHTYIRTVLQVTDYTRLVSKYR